MLEFGDCGRKQSAPVVRDLHSTDTDVRAASEAQMTSGNVALFNRHLAKTSL